jgi:o-succinylbenzoate synthase
MNIQQIDVTEKVVSLKEPFITALRTVTEVEVIEVKITLDSGITGVGSAVPTYAITGESKESIIAAIEHPITDALLHTPVYSFQERIGLVQKCCMQNYSAKAAVDMALHDAYVKSLGIDLLEFFGGGSIPSQNDMTISLSSKEEMNQQMQRHTRAGFTQMKVKLGTSGKEDIARILYLAENANENIEFRIDANQAWSPKEAITLIHVLQANQVPVQFIEQPVEADDLEGLKYVREHVHLPIMADESCRTLKDAHNIIKMGAADMLNIKLMKCGGLNEARAIADLAQTVRMPCMVGSMMESHLSVAPIAALASAHPNITMVDLDAPLWLEDEEAKSNLFYEGGVVSWRKSTKARLSI